MRKVLLLLIIAFLYLSNVSKAQDEVLFSIGDTKVKKSEFEYIYKKNNFSNKADFSKKSLQDYLDLYINFRLKVKEATAQGLNTNAHFKDELSVYEKQLLDAYVDKEIINKIVKQEYERSKKDLNISHIFFTINKDETADSALAKANKVYQQLKAGSSFEEIAKTHSEDKSTAAKGGKVGWVNSYQIAFPELEEAAYSMKDGSFSEPIKTRAGYHIIKLNETRVAKPKIKVAIIKKFFPIADTSEKAKKAIEDTMKIAYTKLKNKTPFEEVVQQYSDDETSKENRGEVDWFGINTYAKTFEEHAYALKDGDFSEPFKTNTAWYIVKRLQTAKPLTYDEAIPVLKAKLINSIQYQYEQDNFVKQLMEKYNATENKENIQTFKQRISQLSNANKFEYKDTTNAKILLKIGSKTYTENDYGKKIQEIYYTIYPQIGLDKNESLLKNATQSFIINYYKNDIKQNNPEYKSLMDEYKNGIMIFALSEKTIWNKASEDTTGLLAYYNNHQADFNLTKRATVRSISAANEKQIKAIHAYLTKHPNTSDDTLITILKQNGLNASNLTVQVMDESKSKINTDKDIIRNPILKNNNYSFSQTYNIKPPKTRSFNECKGYVVAAYQEFLDKQWLQQLKAKYPIVINKTVFEQMIIK